MKTLILSAGVLLLFVSCTSTKQSSLREYPDRYTIELPKGWSSKPKLVKAINEVLQSTIIELDGRQFCQNCKTDYVVKLNLGGPVTDQLLLRQNENFSAISLDYKLFSFRADLVLYEKEKPKVFLRLIREMEDVFAQNSPEQRYAPPASNVSMKQPMAHLSQTIDPRSYSDYSYRDRENQPSRSGGLSQKDLLIRVENKILELRRLLNGLALENQD